MTAQAQHEHAVAELEHQSQGLDEVAASIAAIEKAVFGSAAPRREAIRELGCRIVAQALGKDDGSG
jgi:hypothetical protein